MTQGQNEPKRNICPWFDFFDQSLWNEMEYIRRLEYNLRYLKALNFEIFHISMVYAKYTSFDQY
jgi:hypothetical protein